MTKSTRTPATSTDSELLTIDPVAMNIVNRIAPQTVQTGNLVCAGGLMVEGRVVGDLVVIGGPLVLRPSGVICGNVTVDHDAYLLGTIEKQDDAVLSEVVVKGTAFLASTLNAAANIQAHSMKTYEGSRIDGRIRTGYWPDDAVNS